MIKATIWSTAVIVVLGAVATATAAEHWRGAGWGGDGTGWNDVLNWDSIVPSATSWDVNRTGEQGTPNNHDIHITADGTCGTGTIYDQAGYTTNLTVENGVTMTNGGSLSYYGAGSFTVKSGAFYDVRYGQLAPESGSLTMTIEASGYLYCSTLRHNNGAMVDVHGLLEAWTVGRISAEGTYRLNVYGGGEFVVHTGVPTDGSGWPEGGMVTQYLCSTVTLNGDHQTDYLTLVQAGEPGIWDVEYDGTWTTIRLVASDNCDFTATPSDIESKPGSGCTTNPQDHQITVTNTMVGGSDVHYTITVLNRKGIEVNIADVPWLSLDKLSGGPIAPSGTDIVTATVDYTKLEVGLNMATLRFKCDCDSCEVHDVEITAPFIMVYNGDVDPETPNAGGSGMTFTERSGDSSDADLYRNADGLAVEPNALALDGYELKITDNETRKLKLRTAPSQNIGSTTGATIVGRLRTTFKFGASGENLSIWHDGGGSLGCHWSGAGDTIYNYQNGIPGYLKETARGYDYTFTDQTLDWYAGYHIIRACMGQVDGSRAVRVYVDENPEPVIEILSAANSSATPDSIGFGAGSTAGQQVVYFDWVTGTNAGMFAPNEEVPCIGRSLCLGPGCYESPCNTDVFADADEDGDVDQADFAVFQLCYTGDGGGVLSDPEYCQCFDRRNNDNSSGQDNDIDSFDLAAFEDCASGPGVPADLACDD